MKVTRQIYNRWAERLVEYYRNTKPFDEEGLIIDAIRLSDQMRLYRVLYASAYLGADKEFAGGVLTKDILNVTGWKLPDKATNLQIEQDKRKSKELEQMCREYISEALINELIKKHGCILPVEWRMFYILYVPGSIFTPEERDYIKNNPCWLLPLVDNPEQARGRR